MKKLRKQLFIELRPVTLYKDDFYKIYKIFKEQCEEVTIIADNMKLEKSEGVDDFVDAVLKEEFADISNLKIKVSSPYMTIDMHNYLTRLYASNDSAKDKEIFEELREILKHKQISIFNIQRPVSILIYNTIIIIAIFSFNYLANQKYISINTTYIIVYTLIWYFLSAQATKKHKVLHLKKEYKDTKLFNKCEKNPTICKIIAGIVVSILLAIFTYLPA